MRKERGVAVSESDGLRINTLGVEGFQYSSVVDGHFSSPLFSQVVVYGQCLGALPSQIMKH